MHFLTSLIIFFGFVLVISLGLIHVIWDLSETSAHASPHAPATPPCGSSGLRDGHSNAIEPLALRYQLGVLIRVASTKIERQFATFADVPYQDTLDLEKWEQLWEKEP
jgi:hypothetical protein